MGWSSRQGARRTADTMATTCEADVVTPSRGTAPGRAHRMWRARPGVRAFGSELDRGEVQLADVVQLELLDLLRVAGLLAVEVDRDGRHVRVDLLEDLGELLVRGLQAR